MNNNNRNNNNHAANRSLSALGGEGQGEVAQHPVRRSASDDGGSTQQESPSGSDWDNIYTYTRAQAIADGFQIDVTKTAEEAGIRYPVFITRGVYDQCVAVPAGVTGQDEAGRLWDVVWMLRFAIQRTQPGATRLTLALYVRNSDQHPARLMTLRAEAGPVDIDDPTPSITIMLPGED